MANSSRTCSSQRSLSAFCSGDNTDIGVSDFIFSYGPFAITPFLRYGWVLPRIPCQGGCGWHLANRTAHTQDLGHRPLPNATKIFLFPSIPGHHAVRTF